MMEKLKAMIAGNDKTLVEQLADATAERDAALARVAELEAQATERDAVEARKAEEAAKADEVIKQTLAQAEADRAAAIEEADKAKAELAEARKAMSQCAAANDVTPGTSPVEPGGEAGQSSPAQIYASMPKGQERLNYFRRNKAAILQEQTGGKADK